MQVVVFNILQKLTIAILNNLWQVAFLWIGFYLFIGIVKVKSTVKYNLAIAVQILSFILFVLNLVTTNSTSISFFSYPFISNFNNTLVQKILQIGGTFYMLFLIVHLVKFLIQFYNTKQQQSKYQIHQFSFIDNFIASASNSLKIATKVVVKTTQENIVPYTIGFLKPIIVLPITAITNLSAKQLETIVLHELAHIKRNDFIINVLLQIIEVILYFNPFVKHLNNEIAKQREICCDELVLNVTKEKIIYAEALLKMAKHQSNSAYQFALGSSSNLFLLKNRIEIILGLKKNKSFNKKGSIINALIVFLFGLVMFFMVALIHTNVKEIIVENLQIQNKINAQQNFVFAKNIEPKTTSLKEVASKNVLENSKDDFVNKNKKATNKLLQNKDKQKALQEELASVEAGFSSLAQSIISEQEKQRSGYKNLDKNNEISIIAAAAKQDTTIEKYLMPATYKNAESLIIITTTTDSTGKKKVKIEMEKGSGRILIQ